MQSAFPCNRAISEYETSDLNPTVAAILHLNPPAPHQRRHSLTHRRGRSSPSLAGDWIGAPPTLCPLPPSPPTLAGAGSGVARGRPLLLSFHGRRPDPERSSGRRAQRPASAPPWPWPRDGFSRRRVTVGAAVEALCGGGTRRRPPPASRAIARRPSRFGVASTAAAHTTPSLELGGARARPASTSAHRLASGRHGRLTSPRRVSFLGAAPPLCSLRR